MRMVFCPQKGKSREDRGVQFLSRMCILGLWWWVFFFLFKWGINCLLKTNWKKIASICEFVPFMIQEINMLCSFFLSLMRCFLINYWLKSSAPIFDVNLCHKSILWTYWPKESEVCLPRTDAHACVTSQMGSLLHVTVVTSWLGIAARTGDGVWGQIPPSWGSFKKHCYGLFSSSFLLQKGGKEGEFISFWLWISVFLMCYSYQRTDLMQLSVFSLAAAKKQNSFFLSVWCKTNLGFDFQGR